jgi:hypothetical protein
MIVGSVDSTIITNARYFFEYGWNVKSQWLKKMKRHYPGKIDIDFDRIWEFVSNPTYGPRR